MAKDAKPTPAQIARAARLRSRLGDAAAGGAPAPPKTPREITDEAARDKWARLRKQK